jgi:hypothetical protein
LLSPIVDEGEPIVSPAMATPTMVLVYARKEPERSVSICGQLRTQPKTSEIPILLAVNKYAIGQGNEIVSFRLAREFRVFRATDGLTPIVRFRSCALARVICAMDTRSTRGSDTPRSDELRLLGPIICDRGAGVLGCRHPFDRAPLRLRPTAALDRLGGLPPP